MKNVSTIYFPVIWLCGWGFGAGVLLHTHMYIAIVMLIIAMTPIVQLINKEQK